MTRLLIVTLLLGVSAWLSAQSPKAAAPANPSTGNTESDSARILTEQLRLKYDLDADQVSGMYDIQKRKLRNLADIEALKTSNPALHNNKRQSIQRGTQASIRRLLDTPGQKELFQQTQAEQRRLRAEKRRELSEKNTPQAMLEAAVLDVYLE